MARKTRFIDPGITVRVGTGQGGIPISSSHARKSDVAITASHALTASYALNAQFEITKEVSSSHADNADLALTSSYALTASFIESLAQNLSQDLTPNQNVGAITSGDTFLEGSSIESVLRSMLITYIGPSLGGLNLKNGSSTISNSTRDVGESFTVDSATFSAGVDNPNGDFPQSASLSCTGADIGSFSENGPEDVQASNTITFSTPRTISRANSSGTVSFNVSTEARNSGDTQSTPKNFTFRWRNYLAASSTIISDETTLQDVLDNDLVQSPFDTNISWTATANSSNNNTSNFTYIIYPSSGDGKGGYGTISNIILNGALSIFDGTSGAFTYLGTFTANNNQTVSKEWRVYKSNAPGAFSSGDKLAIS